MQFIWQHLRSGTAAGHASGGIKHDYAQEKSADVPSPVSQKPEKGEKKPPERTKEQLGEELHRDKMQVGIATARETVSHVSLERLTEEMRRRHYDPDTPRRINAINFREAPEAQRENFDALEDVTTIMLSYAIDAKVIQPNEIDDLESVAATIEQKMARTEKGLYGAERAACAKISEIIAHQENNENAKRNYLYLKEAWASICITARQIQPGLEALQNSNFRFDQPVKKEEKGTIIEEFKRNPIRTIGGVLVGAGLLYVAYRGISRFIRWLTSDKKEGAEKEESGWLGKILKYAGIGSGAGFLTSIVLGRILGPEKILSFFEKHGLKISKYRLAQAWAHLVKGEWKQMAEVLWKGVDEKAEIHEYFAKKIAEESKEKEKVEVSPALLFEVGKQNYNTFIKTKDIGEITSSVGTGLTKLLEGIGFKPRLYDFFVAEPVAKMRQTNAVQKFFERHKDEITRLNLPPIATVDDVFVGLKGAPTGTTPLITAAPGTNPQETTEGALLTRLTAAATGASLEILELNQSVAEVFSKELVPDEELNQMISFGKAEIKEAKEALVKEADPKKQYEKNEEIREFSRILEKVEQFKNARIEALKAYEEAIRKGMPREEILARAEAVLEIEEDLREELDHLIARRGFWALAGTLAVGAPQVYRLFRIKGEFKEYGWYKIKKWVKKPGVLLLEGFKLLKPSEKIPELQQAAARAKKLSQLTEREKHFAEIVNAKEPRYTSIVHELGLEADAFSPEKLKRTLASLASGGGITDPKAGFKRELLEIVQARQKKAILHEKIDLAGAEEQLTKERKAPHEVPEFLERKKRIADLELGLARVESHSIEHAINVVHGDLEQRITQEKGHITSHDFQEMDHVETDFAAHKKNVDTFMRDRLEELGKTTDPARRTALMKELEELGNTRARLVSNFVEKLDTFWTRIARTPGLIIRGVRGDIKETAALTRYRQFVQRNLWRVCATPKENPLVKIIPSSKGQLIFYAAAFGTGVAASKDEFTSLGQAAKQVAFDMAPITGTFSDFYSFLKGKEYISGREIGGKERWLLRPLFGIAGGLSDIATLAGIGLFGRAAISGVRAVRGVTEAGKIGRALEKARGAAQSGKEALAVAREQNTIYKGLLSAERSIGRRFAIAGMAGAVTMTLVPLLTHKLSPETQELLGDTTKDIASLKPEDLTAETAEWMHDKAA